MKVNSKYILPLWFLKQTRQTNTPGVLAVYHVKNPTTSVEVQLKTRTKTTPRTVLASHKPIRILK